MCGENVFFFLSTGNDPGSSPRVRGKPLGVVAVCGQAGLIPACAGKTVNFSAAHERAPAHPRVCGENACDWVDDSPARGSSPRVRGKRVDLRRDTDSSRLIPACAGKTLNDLEF